MNIKQRNKRIKTLRFDKNWKYVDIADQYNLSPERVSQICKQKENKEELLNSLKLRYKRRISNDISFEELMWDIKELSSPNRKQGVVARRKILITFLYDDLNLPFHHIGALLDRDHTSVISAYYND